MSSEKEPRNNETVLVVDDQDSTESLSKAQASRLLLKTDLVVMPLAILSMTLAFLDKNALGYAAVFGLREDNNLVGQQYSWLSSIFYFGYLAMEFPNLWLMTKLPIGKYVGVCLVLWGASLCFMASCHNFAGLATIRFLLGVFEAALLPCMMIVNSMWYRKEEQPLRTAFWYNTFAERLLTGIQYIFIIYGAVTVLAGGLVFFALPDSPSKAWFFNETEKKLALVRLAENQTGIDSHKVSLSPRAVASSLFWKKALHAVEEPLTNAPPQTFSAKQILETLRDPKCYCIWACAFGYAIANAGVTNFNPLIIAGYGFSRTKTVLMATPQAAVAMVSGAILTAITFWVPNVRCIFWIFSSLVGMAGAVMVHSLDAATQRNASLAGVYLMGFYNVPWVFMLSLSSSNTAGATKKSFMGISIAVVYAVGNIVGPQFYLQRQAPHYPLGIGSMLCAFALMAFAGISYYFLCIAENKRRDSKYGKPQDDLQIGLEADRTDSTDLENHNFRYTY
ncbi:allantoate permease [Verticillium dahliae VdLs.17]|uniref:Allantoate permease n=1 Tax=Verticillium dahliae (strain VdLs.17 / ATCC MYA-4575 / FGSC 10137) TaxID=498257 RepID=G2X843_VERDV|nr:allantoate permease [Verticillium dahliae VdLs.17]EGY15130.1 allantoate permease [Verticillium dahliae VdLs.17]